MSDLPARAAHRFAVHENSAAVGLRMPEMSGKKRALAAAALADDGDGFR
jgi:hypothetical protein